jgi:peptide/nickel transport system permease protein
LKEDHKYFLNKLGWFLVTFVCAFILNFILPRLMPGDPVAAIVSRMAQGMTDATGVQAIYEQYTELFGTNRPMYEQFFIYVRNVFRGDFGFSFSQYPRTVSDVLKSSILWTIALQFPAIIVGWLIGNTLGALAAYLKGGFDKVLMPVSIFLSNLPAVGMAIILLVIFGVNLEWFPTSV